MVCKTLGTHADFDSDSDKDKALTRFFPTQGNALFLLLLYLHNNLLNTRTVLLIMLIIIVRGVNSYNCTWAA